VVRELPGDDDVLVRLADRRSEMSIRALPASSQTVEASPRTIVSPRSRNAPMFVIGFQKERSGI